MVRDKQLSCNREGEYSIFDAEKDVMIGTISAHPRGFGFVYASSLIQFN
jgi:hypothetical protein